MTGIGRDSVSRQAHLDRRRENPAAPIAKTITVAGDRNRGACGRSERPICCRGMTWLRTN